jgi:hypothetical protein
VSWLSVETIRAMVARVKLGRRQGDARRALFYERLTLAAVVSAVAEGQEVSEQARLVAGMMEEGRAI